MPATYKQGNVLLEEIRETPPFGDPVPRTSDGAVIILEGKAAGRRHALYGAEVSFFSDCGQWRDMVRGQYLGHVLIGGRGAELRHDELGTIHIPGGTYRVRREQARAM